MKRIFVFLGVVMMTIGSVVSAQEVNSSVPLQKSSWGDAKESEAADYIPEVSLDMRGGFNQDFTSGSGRFFGDGLYLDINGKISPHFSYSFNHRLASTYYEDNSSFNGTNWLTLTYETDSFALTIGKDAIFMGSFEYDTYDLDAYYDMNSTFYNAFDCWQWGVSGAWYPAEDHEVLLQFSNSPFSYGEPNLFAYALGWRGAWDCYESYWTANLWQYDSGRYIKALNFGNRFYLGDFTIDLDLMGRFGEYEETFTGYTATLSPSYAISDWGRVFVKAGVETGDNIFGGAGFEYFPLKEYKDIRFHAAWAYNDYMYGHTLNIGVTWKMNFTKAAKRLFHISDK
jgi:hypothetical protein